MLNSVTAGYVNVGFYVSTGFTATVQPRSYCTVFPSQ